MAIASDTRVDSRGGAADGATTGTWLIDPTDFTIAAGGGTQSTSGIGADTLATNLASNNITLATDTGGNDPGDIHVNAAVSWSANTTLTLQATRDINLNASLSGHGRRCRPGADHRRGALLQRQHHRQQPARRSR